MEVVDNNWPGPIKPSGISVVGDGRAWTGHPHLPPSHDSTTSRTRTYHSVF